ncbi:MAG TPA: cytochrome C [Bacillota bacterium]
MKKALFNNFASITKLLIVTVALFLISACSSKETNVVVDKGTEKEGETDVTYVDHVEEIIANNCLQCHGNESPTMVEFNENPDQYIKEGKGPRIDDYENLTVVVNGSEAGALMRRLDNGENTEDGEPGNMYVNLGADDEEREEYLDVLKEWVGHWTLKRENELTEEDYEKFKLLEK